MNISDLNHLEIVSEESISDLIGAGTASASFSFLTGFTGPTAASMTESLTFAGTSTPTSATVTGSFSFSGFSS